MSQPLPKVYLARHGETAWSLSGQHTGRTDIPLTERGERNARQLGDRLRGLTFSQVLSSPLQRAKRTCELAGFGSVLRDEPDLLEWHYGDYEGLKTAEIRQQRPGWDLFRDGCPNGETLEQVATRVDRLIQRVREIPGDVLLFSHGHLLRVLTARWLELPAVEARRFLLSAGALCTLSYEHNRREEPALALWNDVRHIT
ncbi:MAG: histidine phosphatase family protein [Planctomycetia bacterium]|nr:histidine phosphatase family protein [Planctomycetia bacterium]